ncbi:hypothetical protein ON010_g9450 [Phytophthora cinnamomi]|nr:hypothetical protein ON010_g9450 [Phytophthora cinnamomi]
MLQLESVKVIFDEHSDKMVSKFGEFKLVIIGSCPTKESEKLVATLQAEARNLGVQDHVEFLVNASYADMKPYMERASIGIHTMSNEHFGISNVEIMAAGIIHIANDSAGPKYDIVKPGTGYLASTAHEYAARMWQVINQAPAELVKMRQAARESTRRFSDEHFKRNFIAAIEVGLRKKLGAREQGKLSLDASDACPDVELAAGVIATIGVVLIHPSTFSAMPQGVVNEKTLLQVEGLRRQHHEGHSRDHGEDAERADADVEHNVAELDDAAVQHDAGERDRHQEQPTVREHIWR